MMSGSVRIRILICLLAVAILFPTGPIHSPYGSQPTRDIGSPVNMEAEVIDDLIRLSWEPPDIGAPTVTAYRIYRSLNATSFSLLREVSSDVLSIDDDDLEYLGDYQFYATSVSGPVESSPGDIVRAYYEKEIPSIDLSPDLDGDTVPVTTLTISWNVVDIHSGVEAVFIRIDEGDLEPVQESGEYILYDLEEGPHTIEVIAVDVSGNTGELEISYVVDRTAPVISITAPDPDIFISDSQVNITWIGTDLHSSVTAYSIRVDDGPIKGLGKDTHYLLTVRRTGEIDINVSAVDEAGNSGFITAVLVSDLSYPQIRIMEPFDGSFINDRSVMLKVEASDSGAGIVSYNVYVDGERYDHSRIGNDIRILGLSQGYHDIEVEAVDGVDHNSSAVIGITIDTTEPGFHIISPTQGAYLNDPTVVLKWNSSDPISGISKVSYSLDGSHWVRLPGKKGEIEVFVGSGNRTILMKFIDRAGNEIIGTIDFTVDVSIPRIMSREPDGDDVEPDSSITIEFDEMMDSRSVEINVENRSGIVSGGPKAFSFTPDNPFEPGETYTVHANGRDIAGNPSNRVSWEFTIKDSALVFGFVYGPDGSPLEGASVVTSSGRVVESGPDGRYEIDLKISEKTLDIIKDGFISKRIDVNLTSTKDKRIPNIQLESEKDEMGRRLSRTFRDPYNYLVLLLVIIILSLTIYLIKGSPFVERTISRIRSRR